MPFMPDQLTKMLDTEQQTSALGEQVAKVMPEACVIYFHGVLGAGKTTFIRGILRGMGYQGAVKSPTYTIIEPYQIGKVTLLHIDLYRLIAAYELSHLGLEDYGNQNVIYLIEWPEHGHGQLPAADINCDISLMNNGRAIRMQALTPVGEKMLASLQDIS